MRTKHVFGLFLPALVAASAFGASGCFDEPSWRGAGDNEIVFGISQAKQADGKVVTTVGYEFLDVMDNGWSTYGFTSRDRSCWAERLDGRAGKPRVEGGVAKFQGGLLPPGGIAVVANRPDELTLDAPAWSRGGESLTFEARGFAMPEITPERVVVPSTELTVTAPAADAEVTLDANADLEVSWAPGDASVARETVVGSFVSKGPGGSRGVELRCFFDRRDGKGVFPRQMVQRFAALAGEGEVKGALSFATHRQLTIFADGGWIVYVVATAEQRTQGFALKR